MATRKQQLHDYYDRLLPLIEEAAIEYYNGSIAEGFRHWAIATYFTVGHDVQGNDIVEATKIDGADDFEVDGYFIPDSDDDSVIHLFQSKQRDPGTTMGAREFAAFLNAPNRLMNPVEVANCRNVETKLLHDELLERMATTGREFSINLVWLTSGTLSPAARRNEEANRSRKIAIDVNGVSKEVIATLECLDLADLYHMQENFLNSDEVRLPCDFEFQIDRNSYHETDVTSDYKTLSMTLPAKVIIDLFARHSYRIFRLNPRGPLGNKVNNSIKATLVNEIDRRRFHLLNNGITAICEGYNIVGDEVRVRDFQIINGCQTAMTLWNVRALLRQDPSVLVSVKLTECLSHFAPTIARTTNSQTRPRAEDFRSNDAVQIRLQEEFRRLTPPWFYQIKRGEWDKILSGSPEKQNYKDNDGGYRKLTSKEVAQALLAFVGFPGEAKDKIREFLDEQTIPSIAREDEFSYQNVYNDAISARQLLLPAVIQRKVWRQVANDKAKEPWLEYARFHLVWLIGDLLRERYGLHGSQRFSDSVSESLANQIQNWFGEIYEVAVEAVRSGVEDSEHSGNYREFFRSAHNYRMIESKRPGALRFAQRFGDPFANLPPM